jgi:catechol 2,3-dioxygenase-like lactoylglutathione lyase family enzyme
MELHRGRMIDHLQLSVNDLEASKRFYRAASEVVEGDGHFYVDELWVEVGDTPSHVHFAFQARDRETVDRFHKAVLAAGGRDNGPPGERKYHPGYYAAYAFDPDGNNVEGVYHGPHQRSTESVKISF